MGAVAIESEWLTPKKHGFFTRMGGVSEGIYAGLNCGLGSRDVTENVVKNRSIVAEQLAGDGADLVTLHQIHSALAIEVSAPFEGKPPECDAAVCRTPGIVIGALSADCAPILFEDRSAGVVAAAHAGWRGALGGVVAATVDKMLALGAERARIRAAVGPCISQNAYEVGPEFLEAFTDNAPEFATYFAGGSGDRLMFNLPRFVLDRLREEGLGDVGWTGDCTYGDPGRFFSYRRSFHESEPDYGRLVAAITL